MHPPLANLPEKKMRHDSLALCTLASAMLLALACGATVAIAGDVPPTSGDFTDAQSKQLQLLSERIDLRLNAGLAGSEKEAEGMRSELKQIAALKDPLAVAKAVVAYQARHAAFHAALMARSGVSLVAVAKEMQQIAPNMIFEARPDGTIAGRLSRPASKPAPQSPPAPSTKTVALSGLVSEGSTSCGEISGGGNRFSQTLVESHANATLAGRCVSRGSLRRALDTGGARHALLTVRHGTSVDLWTVSIIGSSSAYASMTVMLDNTRLSGSSHLAWAPFLWAASLQASTSGQESRIEVPVTGSHQLELSTHASASAAIGADSRSKATVNDISGTLQLDY